MARSHKSIADRLHAAALIIHNSLNTPEILALVSVKGYNEQELRLGDELYQKALKAAEVQNAAASVQREKTAAVEKARTAAEDVVSALAKTARAVLDESQWVALGIEGKMSRTTAGLLGAAAMLFDNAALPDIQAKLAGRGYDTNALDRDRVRIKNYETADREQEQAKSAALQATTDQDAALKAMDEWLKEYVPIARVALRHNKDALTALGLNSPPKKKPKKKGKPEA